MTSSPRITRSFPWWCALAAFAFWEAIAVLRYRAFDYAGGDLALFSHIEWNLVHGRSWTSLLPGHFLGNHANLLAYALVPLYALAPSPLTLLTLKVFCCTFAVIPLHRIASRLLDSPLAACVAVAFLLYAPLTHAIVFEFDYEALAPIFLFWLWVAFMEGRRRLFLGMAMLSSLLKENLPLVIVMFGLMGLLTQPQKRWWAGVTAAVAAYFALAVFVIIPAARGGEPSMYWSQYAQLMPGSQAGMASAAAALPSRAPGAWEWLWRLLAPTGFIALLGPEGWLLGLPIWLQRLLANTAHQFTGYYYYNAVLAPFIFVGVVYGLRRACALRPWLRSRSTVLGVGLVGCALWTQVVWGPLFVPTFFPYAVIRMEDDAASAALLRRIPPSAAVLATSEFLPALSGRSRLYNLYDVYADGKLPPPDLDYLLIDMLDPQLYDNLRQLPGHADALAFVYRASAWRVDEAVESLLLLQRVKGGDSVPAVVEDVGTSLSPSSAVWRFEGGLEVSGTPNLTPPASRLGPAVTWDLTWKVESAGWGIYDVLIVWKDFEGRVVNTSVIPIGARVAPMSQWPPQHWMRQTVRVLVPRSLRPGSYRIALMVIHEATRQPVRLLGPAGESLGPWVPLTILNAVKQKAKINAAVTL